MIAQIGAALTEILRKSLTDILPKSGQIGMYSPHERGDLALGLYLYSIRSCHELNTASLAGIGRNIKAIVPRFFTLYYLMTAYSSAEIAYRSQEEHKILTRAMAAFDATPILNQGTLGFKPGAWVDELKLEFVDLEIAELARAWEHQTMPLRLSVAYKVCPVELSVINGNVSQRIGQADTFLEGKKG